MIDKMHIMRHQKHSFVFFILLMFLSCHSKDKSHSVAYFKNMTEERLCQNNDEFGVLSRKDFYLLLSTKYDFAFLDFF